MSSLPFSELPLSEAQVANLESLEYRVMTPIQASALPPALAGEDIIAQAKTGSGKTAVFALAMLAKLDLTAPGVQALVLCPTRELSIQVSVEIRRLARHRQNITLTTVYGGQPIDLQKRALKNRTHIVVGTPGRIIDHLDRGTLQLNDIMTLVLDEADRMLEMGFQKELDTIVRTLPKSRQTMFFSATFPPNIEAMSSRFQRKPRRIAVDERHDGGDIEQHVYTCEKHDRLQALKTLLLEYQPTAAVVFCNFKDSTREVSNELFEAGFSALALNGDLEQREREEILIQFKHQSCSVLVATDVAARGLDIKDLPVVINYELPPDPEVYVHRIGRTGRAGKTGVALSLCPDRERRKLDSINQYQDSDLIPESLQGLQPEKHELPPPPNVTFYLSGGRKAKVRAGEILGALTAKGGIQGKDVGKIDVMDFASYVAVKSKVAERAGKKLRQSKIKGRSFKVRQLY